MSDKDNGFVQGTPVHTKEGLIPIEQIKVGDYVLAKPESGEGEAEYKRVTKTFEHHDKELMLVQYTPAIFEKDGSIKGTRESEDFFIVTPNHPIWLKGKCASDDEYEPVEKWVHAKDLFDADVLGSGGMMILELGDGRLAKIIGYGVGGMIPIVGRPEAGMFNSGGSILYGDPLQCYDFSSGKPVFTEFEHVTPEDVDELLITEKEMIDGHEYVWTYPKPLLGTVYNIEVEDHHTYYVGKYGVLVHGASG